MRRETIGQVVHLKWKAVLEIAAERRNFKNCGRLIESYAETLADVMALKPEEIAAKVEEIKCRPKGRKKRVAVT